jgi:hypothetical protein
VGDYANYAIRGKKIKNAGAEALKTVFYPTPFFRKFAASLAPFPAGNPVCGSIGNIICTSINLPTYGI